MGCARPEATFVELLRGDGYYTPAPRAAPAIMTWGRGNHSVRKGFWRYTRYHDGGEELYDLRADPHEWTNLAARSAFREVVFDLSSKLPA